MAVQFAAEHKRTSEYRFYPEDIYIKPDVNGRHDKPDVEWLISDILTNGQHTPVVIRSDGGIATLCAGFSRWRAVSEINKRGLSPVKMQLRCTYVQCSEAQAFLLNISENRVRNPTTPLDDAHNIQRLLNVYAMTEDQVAKIYFPTAATDDEIKRGIKFVRERTALISLTPEAQAAVKSGRVKESAAVAISRLSEAQQTEVLKKEGTIARKDVVPVKPPAAPKPAAAPVADPELRRRASAFVEDVPRNELYDERQTYVEVNREALVALVEYVEGL